MMPRKGTLVQVRSLACILALAFQIQLIFSSILFIYKRNPRHVANVYQEADNVAE